MLRYKSGSTSEEIELSGEYIKAHIKTAGFYDYEWEVDETTLTIGSKVNGFGKKAAKYILTLDFRGSKEKRAEMADRFYRLADGDILTKIAGRLYFKDSYIRCFIVSAEFDETDLARTVRREATVYVPYPFWIRETPYYFKAAEITSTNNKRYAGRYAYRYANGLNNTYIINDHYAESNFRMVIYGPCVKPSVYIGGYEYHVDITLESGEYMEIDSAAETVTKYMVSGIRVNAFNNRSFQNNIFRPVQPGQQDVSWDGSFDFDLILFEERSEPRWS